MLLEEKSLQNTYNIRHDAHTSAVSTQTRGRKPPLHNWRSGNPITCSFFLCQRGLLGRGVTTTVRQHWIIRQTQETRQQIKTLTHMKMLFLMHQNLLHFHSFWQHFFTFFNVDGVLATCWMWVVGEEGWNGIVATGNRTELEPRCNSLPTLGPLLSY